MYRLAGPGHVDSVPFAMTGRERHPELSAADQARVAEVLLETWGFDRLRPMQEAAIAAVLERRDSVLVLPTGGGKSLTYQLPPLVHEHTGLVISPLIALMKDQVDGLRLRGYPAAALNSTVSPDEARRILDDLSEGHLRLLFVSPERLLSGLLDRISTARIRFVAIDEAHCISQWGHDFRPEYRRLSELRRRLPKASLHAITATATPEVREDIVHQLGLREPAVLVGNFDRPNLTYRILPRRKPAVQAAEAIQRHKGEAAIVYCLSRRETEDLAAELKEHGIKAKAYHAGMGQEERRKVQEAFATERVDVVVATVAFGMGIDRSNVRCVVHVGIPKSIEHYQQETGRAGRDGLPAECVLLYSGGDVPKWLKIMEKPDAEGNEPDGEWLERQREQLERIRMYCTAASCRHRMLAEHFGQSYEPPSTEGCGACDACLGELHEVPESTVVAQKILSAVARVGMTVGYDGRPRTFGPGHIASIVLGKATKAVKDWNHDQLPTFGVLRGEEPSAVSSFIDQLLSEGLLAKLPGPFPAVGLTAASRAVLKGERPVKLVSHGEPVEAGSRTSRGSRGADGDAELARDEGLFEALRKLRRSIADERGVPPFIVFADAVLSQLAAQRPITAGAFRKVKGIGSFKAKEFGEQFVAEIARYCHEHSLSTSGDHATDDRPKRERREERDALSLRKQKAFVLFDEGAGVEHVARAIGLAESTVWGYLHDYVMQQRPRAIAHWVPDESYDEILATSRKLGADRLKPVFEFFAGKYRYEHIRLVLTHASVAGSQVGKAAGTT